MKQILHWGPAAAVLLVGAAARAQQLGLDASPEISPWRVLAALALCIVLAIGAAVALKYRMGQGSLRPSLPFPALALFERLGQGARDTHLKSVETLRLSPQAQVCLFTCDEQLFAVVVGAQGAIVVLDIAKARSGEPLA